MIIAGLRVGIPVGYNYIHGENLADTIALQRRWKKRAPQGTSSKDILGTESRCELHAHHGYGAYISVKNRAGLESIEARKDSRRFKPRSPPSFVSTAANHNHNTKPSRRAYIIREGGDAF